MNLVHLDRIEARIVLELMHSLTSVQLDREAHVSEMDLSRSFLLALYRESHSFVKEAGGCDHSVGICYCADERNLLALAEILGWHPANRMSRTLPEPDYLDVITPILQDKRPTEWLPKNGGNAGWGNFVRMDATEIRELKKGQEVWISTLSGARRHRVAGKVKLYKKDPKRFDITLKYGLRDFTRCTQDHVGIFLMEVQLPFDLEVTLLDEIETDYCELTIDKTERDKEYQCINPNCRIQKYRTLQYRVQDPVHSLVTLRTYRVCPNCNHQQLLSEVPCSTRQAG